MRRPGGFRTDLLRPRQRGLIWTYCKLPRKPTACRDSRLNRAYSTSPSSRSDGELQVSGQADFLEGFLSQHNPPSRAIDHFNANMWSRDVLRSPGYEIIPFYSRYLASKSGESRFFAQTVNTDSTVAHVLGLRRKSLVTPEALQTPPDAPTSPAGSSRTPDFLALMHLGRDLEAHPGIVNGGFQSVLFDEVMYCALLLHAHNLAGSGERPKHYTLDLQTKFLAPVRVEKNVLVRAGLVYRVGRKWQMWAEIVDERDQVLTTAESLWITAKKAHGPLADD